jgi:hypothetical protein
MDETFKRYRRKGISELRPYVVGEDLTDVSISKEDAVAGSPKLGDWIARNPENHKDRWLMSAQFFIDAKLEPIEDEP